MGRALLAGALWRLTAYLLVVLSGSSVQNLRESEARASRVLQSIGDAVIVTDADTRVTRMNPIAEQLTGWTMRDAEGELLANWHSGLG